MRTFTIIGLMSGTSIDGVDAALLETDGKKLVKPRAFYERAYSDDERRSIRAALGIKDTKDIRVTKAETLITNVHIEAVHALLINEGLNANDIDYIGFHGQTIFHDTKNKNETNRITIQIGNAQNLADETGIKTVYDFRSADVNAGGQGAPLLPLYHRARAGMDNIKHPAAILNLGGVGNITWLGGGDNTQDILAFDTGPANALMDDVMKIHTNKVYDENGDVARRGNADMSIIKTALKHPYFKQTPPKSLDRDDFAYLMDAVKPLMLEDTLATLNTFTVQTIARAFEHLPCAPSALYVTGGGRKNAAMMEALRARLNIPVRPVEDIGWNGDALEAEGFAYLAARHVLDLPLSLPTTTGAPRAITGGTLVEPLK